jgi:hypothetical protein
VSDALAESPFFKNKSFELAKALRVFADNKAYIPEADVDYSTINAPMFPSEWLRWLSAAEPLLGDDGEIFRKSYLRMQMMGLVNFPLREIERVLGDLADDGGRSFDSWMDAADDIVAEVSSVIDYALLLHLLTCYYEDMLSNIINVLVS